MITSNQLHKLAEWLVKSVPEIALANDADRAISYDVALDVVYSLYDDLLLDEEMIERNFGK